MANKNIKTHHPLYDKFAKAWLDMRDAVDGEEVVKAKGITYLPMKTGMLAITDSTIQSAAYLNYQTRAEFPEITSPTINGSRGLIHSKPTTYKLPPALEYLIEKATPDGQTLASLHEKITTEILTTGRYGLLPGVSSQPSRKGQFYLAGYSTESIINWDKTDGVSDYVVLDESGDRRDPDTNVWSRQEQYLECRLDPATGAYTATRYVGDTQEDLPQALKKDSTPLQELPFVFINTLGLEQDPDDVPMWGLAKIAYRIYRMDADYTHGLHMTSEPTPWVSGYDNPGKAKENGDIPTAIGATQIWVLPKGGQAGFLEFNGPGLEAQAKAIGSSLERAVLFGAQVLSDENQAAESGNSRRLRIRGQESILLTINRIVAQGLQKALRNIAVWAGEDPLQVVITPPEDIVDHTLGPAELTSLVNGWMSGAYSKQTLFYNIKRGSMVPQDRTYEDEQQMIEDEPPALAGVTPAGGISNPMKKSYTTNEDPKSV